MLDLGPGPAWLPRDTLVPPPLQLESLALHSAAGSPFCCITLAHALVTTCTRHPKTVAEGSSSHQSLVQGGQLQQQGGEHP